MKKLISGCLGTLLLLILFISCQTLEEDYPSVWRCTSFSNGMDCFKVIKDDPATEEDESQIQERHLTFTDALGYQCTSPDDYNVLQQVWDDLAEEVLIYRSKYGRLDYIK